MNSLSRTHCNDDSDVRCNKQREDDCHRKDDCHKKAKETEVLLKCKTGSSVTIPNTLPTPTSITLNTLALRTEDFCNPCIKFEFAANIITAAAEVTLEFQIFKQCRRQFTPTTVGPVWTFSRPAGTTAADAFTFIVCDCECDDDSCFDDCCTFTVVVTATETGAAGTTFINNPTFSALVVEKKCLCR